MPWAREAQDTEDLADKRQPTGRSQRTASRTSGADSTGAHVPTSGCPDRTAATDGTGGRSPAVLDCTPGIQSDRTAPTGTGGA